MGERSKQFRERIKLYRPAKRMVKRMKAGDFSQFEESVSELEDEDIVEFLQKLDKQMDKRVRVAMDPLIQTEYMILIEEKKRREESEE